MIVSNIFLQPFGDIIKFFLWVILKKKTYLSVTAMPCVRLSAGLSSDLERTVSHFYRRGRLVRWPGPPLYMYCSVYSDSLWGERY